MKRIIFMFATIGITMQVLGGCAATRAPSADESPVLIYQTVAADAHPVFRQFVESSAASRHTGFEITTDANNPSPADFRLDLDFRTAEGNFAVMEAAWAETTTMLLTMYPATCGRYNLELNADLYDSDGEPVGSWNLIEQDTAFLWLFQGKDCGRNQSDETIRKYSSRMLDDLYSRIRQELPRPNNVGAPGTESRRIFVDVRETSPALQRIVRSEARGRGFTFDPDVADRAEYAISVSMYSTRPEQGVANLMGRSAGAIMTIGLISMCPPNEMILAAAVSDRTGETMKEYRFSRRVRASGLNYCERPTVGSHPKQATKLVRQLFRQMKKDGIAPD